MGALVDLAGTNPGFDVLRLVESTRGFSFLVAGVLPSCEVAVDVGLLARFVDVDETAEGFSGLLEDTARTGDLAV